jgi:hypothetical protein
MRKWVGARPKIRKSEWQQQLRTIHNFLLIPSRTSNNG